MSEIIRTLEKMKRCLGTYEINILRYADDAVLFAECQDDLERVFSTFVGLKLNKRICTEKKTKCVSITKKNTWMQVGC